MKHCEYCWKPLKLRGNQHLKRRCNVQCTDRFQSLCETFESLIKRRNYSEAFKCANCGAAWSGKFLPTLGQKYCDRRCATNATRTPYALRKLQPSYQKYQNETRKKSVQWRLAKRLRGRLYEMLDGCKKESALALLGCSIEDFKAHLQSKFKKGMAWNNYGLWHIDHIQPCASFDLSIESQRKLCFHWTNFQPLWKTANQSKGDKITVPQLHMPL